MARGPQSDAGEYTNSSWQEPKARGPSPGSGGYLTALPARRSLVQTYENFSQGEFPSRLFNSTAKSSLVFDYMTLSVRQPRSKMVLRTYFKFQRLSDSPVVS